MESRSGIAQSAGTSAVARFRTARTTTAIARRTATGDDVLSWHQSAWQRLRTSGGGRRLSKRSPRCGQHWISRPSRQTRTPPLRHHPLGRHQLPALAVYGAWQKNQAALWWTRRRPRSMSPHRIAAWLQRCGSTKRTPPQQTHLLSRQRKSMISALCGTTEMRLTVRQGTMRCTKMGKIRLEACTGSCVEMQRTHLDSGTSDAMGRAVRWR
mmetsp:Transcript_45766/g.93665  ORF Transcript_45766/g.93665 Transcript_45766/m.93665 type:complete len:211 (-) Transcript_45766:140-772(-)